MWSWLHSLYQRVNAVWYVLGVAGMLLLGGYVANGWASGLTSKSEMRSEITEREALQRDLEIAKERLRILEELERRAEEDRKIVRQQIYEIARSVGAPIVPGVHQ